MFKKFEKYLIVLLLLFFEMGLAQEKNPTVYPYGGVQDSSRRVIKDYVGASKGIVLMIALNFKKAIFVEVQFHSRADFKQAQFHSLADFGWAQFDSLTDFEGAQFDSQANFGLAQFHSLADFGFVHFDSRADFEGAQFDSGAGFTWAQFDSRADFKQAQFHSLAVFHAAQFDSQACFGSAQFHGRAVFEGAQFDSRANFGWAQFHSRADFKQAQFHSLADFGLAQFDSLTDFEGAQFDSGADFRWAQFIDIVDFNSAVFNNQIDFRWAHIDSIVDFSLAEIKDTVLVGIEKANELQRYDFMRATLLEAGIDTIEADSAKGNPQQISHSPGAKIELYGPVDLKIQLEKFKFITLCNELDYYSKKDIISTLKQVSFKGNEYQKERFELDYIFAKSTMYQSKSTKYARNRWYQVWKYPNWSLNILYYITMGLGYRPFRLAWWVLDSIIAFSIFYFFKMRDSINRYILKKYEMKESKGIKRKRVAKNGRNISHTESLMNCFYFSSMLLFTFRLKGEILTFFGLKEKRIIVGEYLLGLLIYISFLTLAKSGSILHNLKSLFIG